MYLSVDHLTEYDYSEPQARLVQLLRLTPDSSASQAITDWRIDVDRDARLRPGRDGYGNLITMLYIDGPLERIGIRVTGNALTQDRSGILDPAIEVLPSDVFLQTTPLTKADAAVAALIENHGLALDRLHGLNTRIHEHLILDADPAPVTLTPDRLLTEGHGRPADFAHLFIAAARSARIPARIATGYCHASAETSSSPHNWAEAFVEGLGWVGFDPIHGRCPDENYIRIASGLDYRDAAPLSGARTGGGDESLAMTVQVSLSQNAHQQ